MAILSTAKVVGKLVSARKTGRQVMNAAGEWVAEIVEDFKSGFVGQGWRIWEYVIGKWKLEIDSIVVRETMVVFELLIQKIRAVKGALCISQACGKVKTAALDSVEGVWLLTVEDEMSFIPHDLIRCQGWKGDTLKGYWVEIREVRKVDGVDVIVIPVGEFTGGIGYVNGMEAVDLQLSGMDTPVVGDDIVQFGNTVDTARQSAIYLHADEGGQPALDMLFGIKRKSFAGCVKQRIGGDIPGTDGLRGFYCENGMIKGVDGTGHVTYCIYPDGTAEFGGGSARFGTDRSGHIAGGAISWQWDASREKFVTTLRDVILQWDNLSEEVRANLKGANGEKGEKGDKGHDGNKGADGSDGVDANLLSWVQDWDKNKTMVGSDYLISPRLFAGMKEATGRYTGVSIGRGAVSVLGAERTGMFGVKDGKITFELDALTGDAVFRGLIYSPYKEIVLTESAILNITEYQNFKIVVQSEVETLAILTLPCDVDYDGAKLRILLVSSVFSFVGIRSSPPDVETNQFIYDGMDPSTRLSGIVVFPGSEVRLCATRRTGSDFVDWVVENYNGVTILGIGTCYDCFPESPKETGWYKRLNENQD